MRALIATVLLAGGVLLTSSLHHDAGSAPAVAVSAPGYSALSVSLTPGALAIRGTTASAEHEAALRRLAQDLFAAVELQEEFVPGVLTAAHWEAASNRLLYAMAALDTGEATMNAAGIRLRGVSSDAGTFKSRIDFLREALPGGYRLETDIVTVRSTASIDELCRRAFAEIVFGPVSFAESSAEIRPVSRVTLDRIVEFAHDCPAAGIAITGHTDGSGNESWNRQLSLARAQAVADYIAGNGIDPARLIVAGVGSAEPVADNSTAAGRELNRRIEFGLREP